MIKDLILGSFLGTANALTRRLSTESRARWAIRLSRSGKLSQKSWRAVQSNLDVINAWSHSQFKVEKVFENFALTLTDFLSQAPVTVNVEGREKAEAVRAEGKGVIFMTSHLGHWELGGHILSDWGWAVTAVYQAYRSQWLQNFIHNRRAQNLRYLAVGQGAAFGAARVLKKGGTVAFLGDRPFGETGALVPLCGRPARLPKGPFLMACRHRTPILCGFVIREKPGVYRAFVEDALRPEGDEPQHVENLLRQTSRILGKYITRYGDQWFCFEKVWE